MIALYAITIIINFILMRKKRNVPVIIFTIVFIIALMGLNTYNSDYIAYEGYYNSQIYDFNVEPGYRLFSAIIHGTGVPYNVYLCVYFSVIILIGVYIVTEMKGNLHCFLALYMLTALFLDACEIRQAMAYFLYALALLFISKEKKLKAIVTVILASCFQISSLVLIPIPFLVGGKRKLRKILNVYSLVILSFCGIVFLNGNEIPGLRWIMGMFLSEDKLVYFDSKTRFGFILFFFANFINYCACSFSCEKMEDDSNIIEKKYANNVKDALLFLNCAMPLCMINSEFLRYFRFSVIPVLVLFSLLAERKTKNSLFLKEKTENGLIPERLILLLDNKYFVMVLYIIGYMISFQHFRVMGEILNNNLLF